MLTGEIRSQIDSIWNDFRSGGLFKEGEVVQLIQILREVEGRAAA